MIKIMKFSIPKQIIISFFLGLVLALLLLKFFEVIQVNNEVNRENDTPFSYNSAISKASPAGFHYSTIDDLFRFSKIYNLNLLSLDTGTNL